MNRGFTLASKIFEAAGEAFAKEEVPESVRKAVNYQPMRIQTWMDVFDVQLSRSTLSAVAGLIKNEIRNREEDEWKVYLA